MKILHTSDLHLGKKLNGFTLHDNQEEMLNHILDIVCERNIDILVIAGDIYDSKIPSTKAIELFDAFLHTVIIDLDKNVIMITGNHDSYERFSFGKRLYRDKLYIAASYNDKIDTMEIGNVCFHMIPYENYQTIRVKVEDESITNFDAAYDKILTNHKVDDSKINICIAHGYFSYAKKEVEIDDSVRKISIGGSEIVDIRYFDIFDICMFGHLHRPQKVINELFRYSGTPMKYSFSEVNHQKSVCIYNVEADDIAYELLNINVKNDLYLLSETVDTLLDEGFYNNLNLDGYFKLEIKGGVPSFELNKLKEIYKNIVEITYDSVTNNISTKKSRELKTKSDLELFVDFYEESLGEEMDIATKKLIEEVIANEDN